MNKPLQYLTIFIFTLLLSACQTGQSPLLKKTAQAEVVEAEVQGDYFVAAAEYLKLAQTSNPELAAHYQLRAAELYAQLAFYDESVQTLQTISFEQLSTERLNDFHVLATEVYANQQQLETALTHAESIKLSALNTDKQITVLNTMISAYEASGNWLEKAKAHLMLNKLVAGEKLTENHQALWHTLMELTPQALDLYNPGIPPDEESGWFSLAYIVKSYASQPEVLNVALEDWERSYPNHPADTSLYESVISSGTHLSQDIKYVAVLLPSNGPYASAAQAIKDGILAAHFADNRIEKLKFIDVHVDNQGSDVIRQYDSAVAAGAEIVIGPLLKQSIDELALKSDLSIPVLALNRIDEDMSRPNLLQFGLAPEDDAVSVANYASTQGYKRVIVLSPEGNWGQRIADAFTQKWRELDGQVVYQSQYNESENDFSNTLRPLMGLDISQQRYQSLKSLLGRKLSFEPRRRQDIDFVFLAAKPLKARQLVPQFKFHRSGKLPILATSHAYAGKANPQQDIDLNGLYITDMPWMITPQSESDPVYSAGVTSGYQGGLKRLFALGVDAYRLIPQLNQMSRNPTIQYSGATGELTINPLGQVERLTSWAQFKEGLIETLQ